MQARIQAVAAAIVMAGCATAPPPPQPTPPPAEAARSETPPAVPTPPTPRPPPTAAEQQQAQKIALRVAELLEAGNESEAHSEIDRALALDPNNKLALNFQRQLTVDPRATLGEESFAYTVRPGETLSRIAGRFLGDIYAFYLLARYNDIRVPRLVTSGQTIRVPGKMPPPEALKPAPLKPPAEAKPRPRAEEAEPPAAVPAPAPAQPAPEVVSPAEKAYREGLAAQRAGNKERAYQSFRQAERLDPAHADAHARSEQLRRELVLHYERSARAAFAKQDLDGAIRGWDHVLELEPGNDTARLEKQKAQELKRKIEKL